MTDVLVGSIDLSVFGGPSNISLDLDFGATGVRGSRIFGLTRDPRFPTTPKPLEITNYDLGIVISSAEPDYLTVYQKVGATPEDWEPFAALYPNFYATKKEVTFTAGVASFEIVVSEVFSLDNSVIGNPFAIERFMVQYQIEDRSEDTDSFPISSSMFLSIAPVGSAQVLTVSLKAIEYTGTVWQPVSGNRVVHSFSTVV